MLTSQAEALVQLRRVPAGQLAPADHAARRWRRRYAALLSPLLGQDWAFDRCLLASLRNPGFSLSPRWAQRALRGRLRLRVRPADVGRAMHDWLVVGSGHLHSSDYFLGDGDWSGVASEVRKLPVFQEARELQACNFVFREASAYRRYREAMAQGRPVVRQHLRLDSEANIDRYFARFVALFASIARHGLLAESAARQELLASPDREIGVAIDRDGRLLKLPGGQHRFAIACLLGLPEIPVEVRLVHKQLLRPGEGDELAPGKRLRKILAEFDE